MSRGNFAFILEIYVDKTKLETCGRISVMSLDSLPMFFQIYLGRRCLGVRHKPDARVYADPPALACRAGTKSRLVPNYFVIGIAYDAPPKHGASKPHIYSGFIISPRIFLCLWSDNPRFVIFDPGDKYRDPRLASQKIAASGFSQISSC